MSNLANLLQASASRASSHVAIEDSDGACTYGQLWERAAAAASSLGDHGIRPGDRVGVLLDRGATAAAALFGVYAAGAVAVVINERLQPRQIEYVLNQCRAAALITTDDVRQRHARPLVTNAKILTVPQLRVPSLAEPHPRADEDFAQIMYTSGSSGLPKGVTFTHGAIATAIATCASYLGLEQNDRVSSLLPFSSVYGLNQLLTTIFVGGTLVVESSPLWSRVADQLRERKITVLAGVPPVWLQLLNTSAFTTSPPRSLRILQNAGGHLPVAAVRRIRELLPSARLFLQYGQTETFRSSYLNPSEVDEHPDSMGRPIPGGEIFVLRADGSECDPDEEGELVFRGPTMAAGYWDNPEATARTFRTLPARDTAIDEARAVYSGDLVRRDAEGRLYFVARAERLIKTMGFRVGPDEVVDVLLASGQAREAAITAEPSVDRGESIIAHVVLTPGGDVSKLLRFCKMEMPSHMIPMRIEVYDALPCLSTGKYDVAALRRC